MSEGMLVLGIGIFGFVCYAFARCDWFMRIIGEVVKGAFLPFEHKMRQEQALAKRLMDAKVASLEREGFTGTMVVNKTYRFADGGYVRYAHLQYTLFDPDRTLVARRFESELTIWQGRGETDRRIVATQLYNDYNF